MTMETAQKLIVAVEKLRSNGVRMTPQRHAVLDFLMKSKEHPTADEIYKALESRFPNMSVATVYNNLRLFKKAGLVRELTYGDASSRFDGDTSDHYHVICRKCGRIQDLHEPVLHDMNESVSALTGFEVDDHRLEFYGVCPDCRRHMMKLN